MSAIPIVLLAEDNPQKHHISRSLLEQCGCRVIEAKDGEEAVHLALHERPRLILLDLKTPVLDGYEAARRIREHRRDVPMLAYTAEYSYSLSEAALEAGFDDYIKKPVDLETMQDLIEEYFPRDLQNGS